MKTEKKKRKGKRRPCSPFCTEEGVKLGRWLKGLAEGRRSRRRLLARRRSRGRGGGRRLAAWAGPRRNEPLIPNTRHARRRNQPQSPFQWLPVKCRIRIRTASSTSTASAPVSRGGSLLAHPTPSGHHPFLLLLLLLLLLPLLLFPTFNPELPTRSWMLPPSLWRAPLTGIHSILGSNASSSHRLITANR